MKEYYCFYHKDQLDNPPDEGMYGDYMLVKDKRPPGDHWVEVPLWEQGLDPDGKEGITPAQLHATADAMLAEAPSGRLVIASRAQVYELFANHPFFMTQQKINDTNQI